MDAPALLGATTAATLLPGLRQLIFVVGVDNQSCVTQTQASHSDLTTRNPHAIFTSRKKCSWPANNCQVAIALLVSSACELKHAVKFRQGGTFTPQLRLRPSATSL